MMAMNANHTECYGYMYMYRSIGQASKVPARTDNYQKFFRRKYKSYISFKLVNAIKFNLTQSTHSSETSNQLNDNLKHRNRFITLASREKG